MWPFKRLFNRSLENPNLTLSDPRVWEEVFGDQIGSAAGVSVSNKQAMSVAAWWQGISMISGDISRLPIRLYRRTTELGQESREELRESDDPRARLVALEPNEFYAAQQFWSRVMVAVLTYGRVVIEVVRRLDGSPSRLLLLDPTKTELVNDESGLFWKETLDQGGARIIDPSDAIHLEWIGAGETDYLVPYKQARDVLGLAIAQQRFASFFFRRGGRFGGILEFPVGTPKKNIDRISTQFEGKFSENAAFTTVSLRDGVKYQPNSHSPEESQLVEAFSESARQVARFLLIPPGMLGVDGSTSYNTKTEENRAYLDQTLSRWITQIEQQLNLKLLDVTEQEMMFFEFDTLALTRLNAKEQSERHALQIQSMVKSPNEVRLELNLPPYEGGDEFANPNTTSPDAPNPEPTDPAADLDPVSG